MAGLWCVNVGYGRKELAEAAYAQLQELPYYNSFFKSAHPPAIELARRLAELTPPQFNHVFFTGSGSEANDTILRMARRYWDVRGEPRRQVVISRENAYHGSTMAGASLGGMAAMHSQGGLPIPGIVHIEQPYWFEKGVDVTPEEYGLRAARRLAEKIEAIGPENVAAFIGEPIQGAGGVIIPPSTYWPEIQRICHEYGILLIADEVVCGFGRTGRWFGQEFFGFEADFMTLAKGITSGYQPLGAVMVGDRVAKVLIEEGGEFHHGYTYSGHPVACAVALANLRILEGEKLVDRVREAFFGEDRQATEYRVDIEVEVTMVDRRSGGESRARTDLRTLRSKLQRRIVRYAGFVLTMLDESKPESRELVEKALQPMITLRPQRGSATGAAGAEVSEAIADEPAAAPELEQE
jgi:putrescine aminotransferase